MSSKRLKLNSEGRLGVEKQIKSSFVDSITKKRTFLKKEKAPSNTVAVSEKKQPKAKNQKQEATVYKKEGEKRFKFLEFKRPKIFSIQGVILIVLLLPIFLFAVASYYYEFHNQGKIFSGVRVFGMEMGGKTKDQAAGLINSKIDGYKLTIEGENQKFEASYADLGINYDKNKILNEAYSYGRDDSVWNNFFNRTKRFLSEYQVSFAGKTYTLKKYDAPLLYNVDNTVLDKYLAQVESKININPKDSQVTTQGGSMHIVPAVFGRKLKTAELKNQILTASTNFTVTPLKIQTDVTAPTISDEKTRVLAEEADKITSKNITLTYQGKTFSPSKETVVSWVTFVKAADQTNWQMVIDRTQMSDYIDSIGSSINIYSTDQKIRVENETKQIVTQAGKDGLVIDELALENQIVSELQSDSQVNIAIPMRVDHFKTDYDYVVVADWDKYIDINLSTQHMDAYLKGGQRVGSWAITSGRDSLPTPLGSFLILRKAYDVCMPNPPSTQPLCGIHYVSYFTSSGDAIHEAWWRSYFGGQDYHWDGSHGCVNAPYSVAEFIYNWAPIGTPVTIHY